MILLKDIAHEDPFTLTRPMFDRTRKLFGIVEYDDGKKMDNEKMSNEVS